MSKDNEIELMVFEKRVKTVFEDMAMMLVAKRRDYGANNLDDFGVFGIVVRLSDKFARIKKFYKEGTVVGATGETRLDAWRDIIGYAVLAILMEEAEKDVSTVDDTDFPVQAPDYFSTLAAAQQADQEAGPFRIEATSPLLMSATPLARAHAPKDGRNFAPTLSVLLCEDYVANLDCVTFYECGMCGARNYSREHLSHDCQPFIFHVEATQKVMG